MTTGKNLLVAVALVLFCSTCSAQWAGDAGTEPQQMIVPNPNSCECSGWILSPQYIVGLPSPTFP